VSGVSTRAAGTLPLVCGIPIALNGLYVLLVAFGNITDYAANKPFVQHVPAMDTTNFRSGRRNGPRSRRHVAGRLTLILLHLPVDSRTREAL
jgi:predicted small integral membrane protein